MTQDLKDFMEFFEKISATPDVKKYGPEKISKRLLSLWQHLLAGHACDHEAAARAALGEMIPQDLAESVVSIKHVKFYSICAHHLLPFFGAVHLSYAPKHAVCGLSNVIKVVKIFSARLWIQEDLTNALADFFYENLRPKRLEISVKARHFCAMMREDGQNPLLLTHATR